MPAITSIEALKALASPPEGVNADLCLRYNVSSAKTIRYNGNRFYVWNWSDGSYSSGGAKTMRQWYPLLAEAIEQGQMWVGA